MGNNQYNPFFDDFKNTETIYVSKRMTFNKSDLRGEGCVDKVRYVEEILSPSPVCGMLREKDQTVLHVTDGGKQKIKATLYEDPNRVTALHIARLNSETGNPFSAWQACFYGEQLKLLYNFLSRILSIDYSNPHNFKVLQGDLEQLPVQTENLFETLMPNFNLNRNNTLTSQEVSSLVTFLSSHRDFWTKAQENGLDFEDIYYSLNMKKRKKMSFYRVLQEITDKRNVEGKIVVVDPKCDKLNK